MSEPFSFSDAYFGAAAGSPPGLREDPATAWYLAGRGDRSAGQGQFADAIDWYAKALALSPENPEFHYRMAFSAFKLERWAIFERSGRRTLELAPRHVGMLKAMAQYEFAQGEFTAALGHIRRAIDVDPADLSSQVTLADILVDSGNDREARSIVTRLLQGGLRDAHLAAVVAKVAGEEDRPPALAYVELMLGQQELPAVPRRQLTFAASKLCDQLGRYDQAFAYAAAGNRMAAGGRYDRQEYSRFISSLVHLFTPERLKRLPQAQVGDVQPVFIVGLPRSGTSLVEQILACHSRVTATGERTDVGDFSVALYGGASDEAGLVARLNALTTAQLEQFAERYRQFSPREQSAGKLTTDKMPQNFKHLGLIQCIFPNAKVIHCRRDLRDTGVSCFLTDFANGNEFSRDLFDLAAYARDYQRLMDHWKAVLDLPLYDLHYESLVDDLPGQVGQLLEYLGLEWDSRCLDFHASGRFVKTSSRDQVRRPIYRSSIGRWKHYQRHIGPLLELV